MDAGTTPMHRQPSWRPISCMGRGDGQVISMLVFYTNDTSSTPAEVYSFFL